MQKEVSMGKDAAAFPGHETPGPGQSADGPKPPIRSVAGAWSPQDELVGGEDVYGDVVERSKPFATRLRVELGWPSES